MALGFICAEAAEEVASGPTEALAQLESTRVSILAYAETPSRQGESDEQFVNLRDHASVFLEELR